jgi:hypothetical protein
MKQFAVIVCIISLSMLRVDAQQLDSVLTTYKDGEYTSVCERRVKVTTESAEATVDKMIEQFHTTPNKLFDWALKGLGFQGQKDTEMVIDLKSATTDKKTGITHGLVDVILPHLMTWRDIKVDGLLYKKNSVSGGLTAYAKMLYSDMVLKKANATYTMTPLKNNELLLTTYLNVRFGWFFNFFITQKRYKSIVEWRVAKFTENMKTESERIEKNKTHKKN